VKGSSDARAGQARPALNVARLSLALLVLCLPLLAQRAPIEDAWDLLRKGQRPQAITLLQQIVQQHPDNADARLLLGSVLTEDGRRDESIAQLTEAVRLRPKSAEAQNALGEAFIAFEDYQSARAPLEQAVALDANFAPARANLGATLLQLGQSDAAAPHLDRAIALMGHSPDAAWPLYLRAKIFSGRGQVDKAAADLQQAVSLRDDFGEAWSDLGDARKTLRDDAGALAAFDRAVKINPADSVAQYRLASELLAQGKPHDAIPHFQEAVRLTPADQSALNGLQRALRADGRTEEADQVREKLADLFRAKNTEDRNSVEAIRLNNEAAALEKSGDLRGALEKYRAALALWPDHTGIRTNLAAALLHLGQWAEGVAELREVLRREPGNEKVRAALNEALAHPPPH
jgi:tetratricopeptide (TPR) repeat protein